MERISAHIYLCQSWCTSLQIISYIIRHACLSCLQTDREFKITGSLYHQSWCRLIWGDARQKGWVWGRPSDSVSFIHGLLNLNVGEGLEMSRAWCTLSIYTYLPSLLVSVRAPRANQVTPRRRVCTLIIGTLTQHQSNLPIRKIRATKINIIHRSKV